MLTQHSALAWSKRLIVLAAAPLALSVLGASTAPIERASQPLRVAVHSELSVAPVVVRLAPHVSPPAVVVKPRARPRLRPAAAHQRAGRTRVLMRVMPMRTTSTAQQRLDAAVAQLPGYRVGDASWILTDEYGSWGTANWYSAQVYISPRVPANRIEDVVVHEWSHLLSLRVYGRDIDATTAAMNRWFGGTELEGSEKAADCMARAFGATWTHYTPCTDAHWRDGARRLIAGQRLP